RTAAGLMHPGICPIHDVGDLGGICYLTMAYIEGESLAARLQAVGRLAPAEAAGVVRKIALAMHAAHARGVVHRDLKPAHIMLTQSGDPLVMDFGLARRFAGPDEVRLTHTGALVGTPAYMPPEQVNGTVHGLGPACDIYSLGVLLYEVLTGRRPFQAPLGELLV